MEVIEDTSQAILNNPPETVSVFVELEEIDIQRANLWHAFSQLPWNKWSVRSMAGALAIIACVIFLLVSIAFWVNLLSDSALVSVLIGVFFIPLLLIGGAVGGIIGGTIVVRDKSRKIYSDLKDFQKKIQFVVSDSGLETINEKAEGRTSWEGFLKVIESDHSFNFFIQRKLFIFIPKRFIAGPADTQLLRRIIKRNLQDKATLQEI